MTWDQEQDPSAIGLQDITELVYAPDRDVTARTWRLANEEMTVGDARVESSLDWTLSFAFPGTWSAEERSNELPNLVAQFLDLDLATFAVTKCLAVLGSVPDEVVRKVIEQLEDIAEYETRLWRKQQEPLGAPNILEQNVRLPAAQ